MSRIVLFFLITLAISFEVYAQEKDEKVLDLLEKGDKFYSRGNYEKAITMYEQVAEEVDNDPHINKRIGVTLSKLERYEESVDVLKNLKESSDTIDIYVNYFLALSFHKLGEYDKAIEMYTTCLDYIDEKSVGTGKENIEKNIAQCKFWKTISEKETDVSIQRLDSNINSPYAEYGAKLHPEDSMMYFTSRRKGIPVLSELVPGNNEQIYTSKSVEGQWQQPKKLEVSNAGSNNAIVFLEPKKNQIYFYSDINMGDLMVYDYKKEGSTPQPVAGEVNTGEFMETSLTIDRKRNVCYFVSNRQDTKNYGGKDIFRATLDSGRWKNIENLGGVVNTKYDEDFVFWSEENATLYFSSDRENAIGGYDIFACKLGKDGFMEPENIGLPINTPFDDISFCRMGNKAWYSTKYEDYKEDVFEIDFIVHEYNPDWHSITIGNTAKIGEYEYIKHVFFEIGKDQVSYSDPDINHLIQVLGRTVGAKIRLTGHSDWTGSEQENNELSFRRVSNLADVLIRKGIDPELLVIEVAGEGRPLTDTAFIDKNNLKKAQALNRTVQIEVLKQGTPYLIIKEEKELDTDNPLKNKKKDKQYAVMVYASPNPEKEYQKKEGIIESHSDTDKVYYYHTPYMLTVAEAEKALKALKANGGAYVFEKKCGVK